MENWFLRVTQMLVAFGVSGSAAAFHWTNNNALIGSWGLIAAIAWTMIYAKAADWYLARKYGWASPFPPKAVIWSVTWKVIAVTIAWLVLVIGCAFAIGWWKGVL